MKPLRADRKTVEGACECIPIIEQELGDHPTLVKLAIMSIAKDGYEQFQILRRTSVSNLSKIMPLKNGLMENIRTILRVLGKPLENYTAINMGDITRTYVSKLKRNPAVGTSQCNARVESAVKCYRTMYSLRYKCFSEVFSAGFEYVSRLLVAHSKGLDGHSTTKESWAELDKIIGEISECELSTVPDPDDADEAAEELRQSFREDEADSYLKLE